MIRAAGQEQLTVEGRAGTTVGTAMENGDVRGGRKMGDQGGQGFTRANLNALYTSSTL